MVQGWNSLKATAASDVGDVHPVNAPSNITGSVCGAWWQQQIAEEKFAEGWFQMVHHIEKVVTVVETVKEGKWVKHVATLPGVGARGPSTSFGWDYCHTGDHGAQAIVAAESFGGTGRQELLAGRVSRTCVRLRWQ